MVVADFIKSCEMDFMNIELYTDRDCKVEASYMFCVPKEYSYNDKNFGMRRVLGWRYTKNKDGNIVIQIRVKPNDYYEYQDVQDVDVKLI